MPFLSWLFIFSATFLGLNALYTTSRETLRRFREGDDPLFLLPMDVVVMGLAVYLIFLMWLPVFTVYGD